MSRLERDWQYAEQYPVETAAQSRARRLSGELGVAAISRAIAAQLTSLVAMSGARALCEIGTGVGVSGLALLRHAPEATLTSIESEPEHLRHARATFTDAGVPAARLRLIEGDASQVLPRMNLASYDLVLIDADQDRLLDYVEHALLIVRSGGTIVIPHALRAGRVSDPAARDEPTRVMRDLLATVAESPAISAALAPTGDGLLTVTKLEG